MRAKELKNSILQLAVSGKLVPQDASDEPAIKLLERIHAERESLVRQKKIKNTKVELITGEDIPFEVPESWEWVRLGDYLDVRDGTHDSPKYVENGYPLVTSKNIKKGSIDFSTCKYITKEDHISISARSEVKNGDILMAMIGTIGNPIIVDTDVEFSCKNVALFKPYTNDTYMEYIQLYLTFAEDDLKKKASGGVQSFVSLKYLRSFLLPLPPLAEQKRICKKVRELMPLVEEYGELEEAREKLDAELPSLLKKSILQQAVQGKLVPQDASDEPASVLLERIRAERESLIKQKKIKNTKVDPITDEDIPFEVPVSWEWVRLEYLGRIVGGGTPKTDNPKCWSNEKDGIPWLTPADMKDQTNINITSGSRYISKEGFEKSSAKLLPAGSVLMSSRAPIGYLGIASNDITTNQGFKSVDLYDNSMNHWILLALESLMDDIKKRASGTTFKEISGKEFGKTLLPLPPLAEQKRICKKVREVMGVVG